MLFHTLTVNYGEVTNAIDERDSQTVLTSMVGYIRNFFGCRECARHFLQMAEDGGAIRRDIRNPDDAILWLWKSHNKANQRLSGDISDDPAFPKEKFPNRQHCSDCYNGRVGGADLWTEFRLKYVKKFLKDMYGSQAISMHGLTEVNMRPMGESHDLVLVNDRKDSEEPKRNAHNWKKTSNSATNGFFSPIDLSLCFSIYLLSAIVLVLCYMKFIAKRKFSSVFSSICPRSRTMESSPLLGKV